MASSGNGSKSPINSVASRPVEPSAKYQRSDDDEAQGDTENPAGPTTTSSAAAWPPSISTSAAA